MSSLKQPIVGLRIPMNSKFSAKLQRYCIGEKFKDYTVNLLPHLLDTLFRHVCGVEYLCWLIVVI